MRKEAVRVFWILAVCAFSSMTYAQGYQVIEVKAGGEISGRVWFPQDRPELEGVKITKDNDVCGIRQPDETFVISDSGGLRNVVVMLKGVQAGKAFPTGQIVKIQQKGCAYVPHVQAVAAPAGEVALEIVNSDGILHNVHAYKGEETIFNVAQPKFKKKFAKQVKERGVLTFRCDVHSWMNAYVVLNDTPYVAVTDAEGHYRMDDIPPGTYSVEAWHEAMGTLEKSATVAGGRVAQVDFEILPNE